MGPATGGPYLAIEVGPACCPGRRIEPVAPAACPGRFEGDDFPDALDVPMDQESQGMDQEIEGTTRAIHPLTK